MERDEHQKRVQSFFDHNKPTITTDERALAEALYAMGELGLFVDGMDSISPELALQIYGIVEVVHQHGFPVDLGM